MRILLVTFCALAAAALAGCSSLPQSRATQLNQAHAPKFTEEEKEAMTTEERAEIYNQHVPDRDKVVCRREKRTGSHMPTTVCRTYAEIEEERVAAQDVLRHERVNAQPKPSDGPKPGFPAWPGGKGGNR